MWGLILVGGIFSLIVFQTNIYTKYLSEQMYPSRACPIALVVQPTLSISTIVATIYAQMCANSVGLDDCNYWSFGTLDESSLFNYSFWEQNQENLLCSELNKYKPIRTCHIERERERESRINQQFLVKQTHLWLCCTCKILHPH